MELRSGETEDLASRVRRLEDSLVPRLDLHFEERKRGIPKTSSRNDRPFDPEYWTSLHSRREFHSSDCLQKLSRGSGLRQELQGFSGTLLRTLTPDRRKMDALWDQIHHQLDAEWSQVALKDGIKEARAGKYDEALKYYKQALELDPKNSDAFVARGAALANKGQYQDAIKDFDKALGIDPLDRVAVEYKDRIEKRLKDREMKYRKEETKPELQYKEDIFGRVHNKVHQTPSPTIKDDVQHALTVLKRSHERRHKSKKHKNGKTTRH